MTTREELAELAARAFEGKGDNAGCVVGMLSSGSILVAMRGNENTDAIAFKLTRDQARQLALTIMQVLGDPFPEAMN